MYDLCVNGISWGKKKRFVLIYLLAGINLSKLENYILVKK